MTNIQVTNCDLGTKLLEVQNIPLGLFPSDPNRGGWPIGLPYNIPGRDYISVKGSLRVDLLREEHYKRNVNEFAMLIKELEQFEIEVEYQYEDMSGNCHSGSIRWNESFDSFRQSVLLKWKETNRYDLIFIVKNISL